MLLGSNSYGSMEYGGTNSVVNIIIRIFSKTTALLTTKLSTAVVKLRSKKNNSVLTSIKNKSTIL